MQCNRCGIDKKEGDFEIQVIKHVAYRRLVCRQCRRLRMDERKKEIRAAVIAYKQERGCLRCGFKDHRALQFHHRDPSTKVDAVAELVRRGMALEKVMAEIAKCDLICANCHSIEHYSEL